MKGIYLLVAKLNMATSLEIGNRKAFVLNQGFYGYVGSALAGLEKRIARHLRAEKKHHWHIDYLLDCATIQAVIYAETEQRKECSVANTLSRTLTSIPGFGSSDCKCRSHLFFSASSTSLKTQALHAFEENGLRPQRDCRRLR